MKRGFYKQFSFLSWTISSSCHLWDVPHCCLCFESHPVFPHKINGSVCGLRWSRGRGWGTHNAGSSSTYQTGCRGRFFRRFDRRRGSIVPLPKSHGILQTEAALHLPRCWTQPEARAEDTWAGKDRNKKEEWREKHRRQHANEKKSGWNDIKKKMQKQQILLMKKKKKQNMAGWEI